MPLKTWSAESKQWKIKIVLITKLKIIRLSSLNNSQYEVRPMDYSTGLLRCKSDHYINSCKSFDPIYLIQYITTKRIYYRKLSHSPIIASQINNPFRKVTAFHQFDVRAQTKSKKAHHRATLCATRNAGKRIKAIVIFCHRQNHASCCENVESKLKDGSCRPPYWSSVSPTKSDVTASTGGGEGALSSPPYDGFGISDECVSAVVCSAGWLFLGRRFFETFRT